MKIHSREASLLKFNTDVLLKIANSISQRPHSPPHNYPRSSRDTNCEMAFTGQKKHPKGHSDAEIQRNTTCAASQIQLLRKV